MPNNPTCRWGILGAATIARKFWQSVRWAENATLTGLASRDKSRCGQFRDECNERFTMKNPPSIFESYEALLQSPEVDAVYIPLPTGVRERWVVAAAENGKHVLCEKPCAVSEASMQKMIDACDRAGVQFMDNVMFMHSQRLSKLKAVLSDRERIGDLKRINSQFSFCADESFFGENIRLDMAMEPWGCLGDLGWYNIRIILAAMNGEMPVRVIGRNLDGNWDRPTTEFAGELTFANGVTASLYCSFVTINQQWVHFSGTRGTAMIDDFTLPWFGSRNLIHCTHPTFNESGFDFNFEKRSSQIITDEYSNAHPAAQEVSLVRTFSDLVIQGQRDSYWPTISQQTQTVMDALLKSAKEGRVVELPVI